MNLTIESVLKTTDKFFQSESSKPVTPVRAHEIASEQSVEQFQDGLYLFGHKYEQVEK